MRDVRPPRVTSWLLAPVVLGLVLVACQMSSGVPSQGETHFLHGVDGVEENARADLWVSYQITVVEVAGVATGYRPQGPCLYWRLTLPAGKHELGLRLDYDSMTHSIRTGGVLRQGFELAAGAEYRLIDLSASTPGERVFQPWLLEGPPADELIELPQPGSGS